MNVRLQGYDYTPLEKFQSYVDRMARRFGFKVVDRYFFSNFLEYSICLAMLSLHKLRKLSPTSRIVQWLTVN